MLPIRKSEWNKRDFKSWLRNPASYDVGYVTSLKLEVAMLTHLPESIGTLTNLTNLSLVENDISSLPESIGNLKNLRYLDLSVNKLTHLPASIGNLTNLRRLVLTDNELTSLPESIGNLTNVSYICVDYNQLTTLPESIGNLMNLGAFSASDNELTSLPESIGNLENLEMMDVGDNQLTSLPESIGNLANLRRLYLSNNQLTTLPESFSRLTNLMQLHLSNNRLTILTEFIDDLRTRAIAPTDIRIDGNPFMPLKRLEKIDGEKELPFTASNAISLQPIHDGNIITDFDNESKYERFYTRDTYKKLRTNPFTTKPIDMKTVKTYKAAIRHAVPANARNAVTGEAIAEGNAMANFAGEADAGRFYKKNTFNSQIASTRKNPHNGTNIDPEFDVKYYRASTANAATAAKGGRRKTRKQRRSVKKNRRR